MTLVERFKTWRNGDSQPLSLRHGALGERAARDYLRRQGMKVLAANFRSERGEIDLILRADDGPSAPAGRKKLLAALSKLARTRTYCLVFAEVKTRSSSAWTRPASAVNAEKRLRLTRCAFDYLRLLKNPPIKIRFDIVEVLLEDGQVVEVRHLPNTFTLTAPYRYG